MGTAAWPVDEWATALRAAQRGAGTIDRYCYHVRVLARTCPDPWAVTTADVEARLAKCRTEEYARACRVALHQFYVWAIRSGRTLVDPTVAVGSIKVPRRTGRPCPETVIAAALLQSDRQTRLMLLLGAQAGLRRFEIAKVHTRDIEGEWLYVLGKGRHERRVALSDKLQVALASVEPGWVFPSARRPGEHLTADAVGRRISGALGTGWSAHTLRHRCATRGYTVTRDLIGVQDQLGHASVATTQRYIGPDRARQRAVADACG